MNMRVVIPLLVLLFFMCGAHTRSTQTEVQTGSLNTDVVYIYAELRELRDLAVEQRGQLTVTQNKLLNTQILQHKLEDELTKMEAENGALHTEMAVLKTKFSAQETELTTVKTRLAATETEVLNLENETTDQPKVAFSAALTNSGYIEARSGELNLVFTQIITNVGQAYSSITGFFTAPVSGVYYFRFTVMDILNSRYMYISMYKNGEQIMRLREYDSDGHYTYLSSGATLQLQVGDVVNMRIPGGNRLWDNTENHNTFSGFLLFPL